MGGRRSFRRLALTAASASLATIGGALGAGLESDEAVREADYTSGVGQDGAG